MMIPQRNLGKMDNAKYTLKTITTALGISALLALSACSGDNTTEETVTTTEAEPIAIEEQEPAPVEPAPVEDTVASTEAASTETAMPDQQAEPELLAANAGAELYDAQCKMCHDTGLLNAPIYGDEAGWSAALAKDKETLYMHSAQGFNQMPAQAVNGVSEAQVVAAVDYMLAAVE